jgi:hypothetical protein
MLDKPNSTTADIIRRCDELFTDLNFTRAREWKAEKPGRIVVGFMPYYAPRELVHAAGGLPLGVFGGGDAEGPRDAEGEHRHADGREGVEHAVRGGPLGGEGVEPGEDGAADGGGEDGEVDRVGCPGRW